MMSKDKKKDNIFNFPKRRSKLEREIEAIIFAADEPLDIETIENRVGTKKNIQTVLENLQREYSTKGINLICTSSNKWIFKLNKSFKRPSSQLAIFKTNMQGGNDRLNIICRFHIFRQFGHVNYFNLVTKFWRKK